MAGGSWKHTTPRSAAGAMAQWSPPKYAPGRHNIARWLGLQSLIPF